MIWFSYLSCRTMILFCSCSKYEMGVWLLYVGYRYTWIRLYHIYCSIIMIDFEHICKWSVFQLEISSDGWSAIQFRIFHTNVENCILLLLFIRSFDLVVIYFFSYFFSLNPETVIPQANNRIQFAIRRMCMCCERGQSIYHRKFANTSWWLKNVESQFIPMWSIQHICVYTFYSYR